MSLAKNLSVFLRKSRRTQKYQNGGTVNVTTPLEYKRQKATDISPLVSQIEKKKNLLRKSQEGKAAAIGTASTLVGEGLEKLAIGEETESEAGLIGAGALKAAGTGATLGAAFGPWGAAIGGVAGGIYGGIEGGMQAKELREKRAERETERKNMVSSLQQEHIGREFARAEQEPESRGATFQTPEYLRPPTVKKSWLQKIGLNKGGAVVGKGTGTSDSVKASLDEGSFVVPAKYSEIAKMIRKKYLNNNGKATVRDGKTPVRLSKGEHLFTPGETDYLRKKGVEIDFLAPKGRGLKKGGKYKRGLVPFKSIEDDLFGDEQTIARTNDVMRATDELKSMEQDRIIEEGEKYLQPLATKDPYAQTRERDFGWKKREPFTYTQANVFVPQSKYEYKKPNLSTVGEPSYDGKQINNLKPTGGLGYYEKYFNEKLPKYKDVSRVDEQLPQDKNVSRETPTARVEERRSPFSNLEFGIEEALGAGQVILGMGGLAGIGKTPEYLLENLPLSPELSREYAEAKRESQYGLTPERKAAALNKIENIRRRAQAEVVNMSRGSAGLAQAGISGLAARESEALTNLAVMDENLRQQKKQQVRILARDIDTRLAQRFESRESKRRRQYEDKMREFDKARSAYAGLAQAGISNIIGARRYRGALEAQKERSGKYSAFGDLLELGEYYKNKEKED